MAPRPVQPGVKYAQVVQGQTEIPQTNVTQTHPTTMTQPANDLTELKQMMKKMMDQMGTLINLISALVNKINNDSIIKDCSLECQWLVPTCAKDKAIYSNP
jgi:hypothetical protein